MCQQTISNVYILTCKDERVVGYGILLLVDEIVSKAQRDHSVRYFLLRIAK